MGVAVHGALADRDSLHYRAIRKARGYELQQLPLTTVQQRSEEIGWDRVQAWPDKALGIATQLPFKGADKQGAEGVPFVRQAVLAESRVFLLATSVGKLLFAPNAVCQRSWARPASRCPGISCVRTPSSDPPSNAETSDCRCRFACQRERAAFWRSKTATPPVANRTTQARVSGGSRARVRPRPC